jgi:hypothetical protein
VAKVILYSNDGETKNKPTETVREDQVQRLEYYDFIGFSNPLSDILPTAVDGPPFLP